MSIQWPSWENSHLSLPLLTISGRSGNQAAASYGNEHVIHTLLHLQFVGRYSIDSAKAISQIKWCLRGYVMIFIDGKVSLMNNRDQLLTVIKITWKWHKEACVLISRVWGAGIDSGPIEINEKLLTSMNLGLNCQDTCWVFGETTGIWFFYSHFLKNWKIMALL